MVNPDRTRIPGLLLVLWALVTAMYLVLDFMEAQRILNLDPELRISWPNLVRDWIVGAMVVLYLPHYKLSHWKGRLAFFSLLLVSAVVVNVKVLLVSPVWYIFVGFSFLQWLLLVISAIVICISLKAAKVPTKNWRSWSINEAWKLGLMF